MVKNDKKIEELEKKLEEILNKFKEIEDSSIEKDKKIADYLDGWKRAQAELINYKKEEEERLNRIKRFWQLEFIKEEIIPILDDLDKAVKNAPPQLNDNPWFKGLVSIKEGLISRLKNQDIEIYGNEGDSFDPSFYEATGSKEGFEAGKIFKVEAQGFKTKDGLIIRPAKVIVGK